MRANEPIYSLSTKNPGFSSWNMHVLPEQTKSNDRIMWSFSIGSQLTSFFGHMMLLNLDRTNCSNTTGL